MGSEGRSNFLGVNYQAWAALALFLQHLRDPYFESIHLEAPQLQDFDLKFTDGRKIICEAKGWKNAFAASHLKKILNDLKNRGVAVGDKETLLIITASASSELKRFLKRLKDLSSHYFDDAVRGTVFKSQEVHSLQKVLIWEIKQEDCANIAFALFSELIDGWVSKEVLDEMVGSILLKKIYYGSAQGLEVSGEEFREQIVAESKRLRVNVGADIQPPRERLEVIKQAIDNPKHIFWAPANLSAVSGHIQEILFTLDLLKEKSNLVLNDWSKVLNALASLRASHQVFEIIKANLTTTENIQFAMDFLAREVARPKLFYAFDFRDTEFLNLANEIFSHNPSFGIEIIKILKLILNNLFASKLFVKRKDSCEYLLEQVGKTTLKLYSSDNIELKKHVVNFVLDTFSLVEDEGDNWRKAPPGVFLTIKDFLCSDMKNFEQNFSSICEHFSNQFSSIYNKKFKLRFKGYELTGGMSTWWGNEFNVKDRYFVREVLCPAIKSYFDQYPNKTFKFIKDKCIFDDKAVSRSKPDFLRRASIPLLIEIYTNDALGKRDEARKLLSILVHSKNGIPSKHHLIYQYTREIKSQDLLWKIVSDAINLRPGPLNPFIEKSICDLAEQGHGPALDVLKKWLSNEDSWSDSIFGGGALRLLTSLAVVDPDSSLVLLNNFFKGEYFNKKIRDMDVYDWCNFLVSFCTTHSEHVKMIIENLANKKELTDTQQILIIGSLAKIGISDNINESTKVDICNTVIKPMLADSQFVEKFSISHVREQLTDYVDGLIKYKPNQEGVQCAVEILEVLVKDPSPRTSTSLVDEKLENDSEVFTIETVRGKVAWSLQQFFMPVSRQFFPRIRNILNLLLEDKNEYIRAMACYPFSVLLGNRYAFTTSELDIPLLADTREKAFKEAQKLEKQAINFISNNLNKSKNLTKNLPQLFGRLYLVNFDTAKKLCHLAELGGVELLKEVIPMFFFYGHFRERLFRDKINNPLALNLINESFDSGYFKNLLEGLALHEDNSLRASLSWHLMKLCDEKVEDEVGKNIHIPLPYFKLLANRYDQGVFRSIYIFIKENHKDYFNECIKLWFELLPIESQACKDALRNGIALYDVQWWPFYFNHEILLEIFHRERLDLFLNGIELLLSYPPGVITGLNEKVAESLATVKIERERVSKIFDQWIERGDYSRLKNKEKWEAQFRI